MKIVVEISNGVVHQVVAEGPCEIAVIDHDTSADHRLPDGGLGYCSVLGAYVDREATRQRFRFAVEAADSME